MRYDDGHLVEWTIWISYLLPSRINASTDRSTRGDHRNGRDARIDARIQIPFYHTNTNTKTHNQPHTKAGNHGVHGVFSPWLGFTFFYLFSFLHLPSQDIPKKLNTIPYTTSFFFPPLALGDLDVYQEDREESVFVDSGIELGKRTWKGRWVQNLYMYDEHNILT